MSVETFAAGPPLQGLEGPVGGLPLLGGSLAARQAEAFAQAGLQASAGPERGPRLLLREDVAVSGATLKAALAIGQGSSADLAFHLEGRSGALAEELRFGDEGPLLLWLTGGEADAARLGAAARRGLDPRERLVKVPVPGAEGAQQAELPLSDLQLAPVGHWLQLLWANLLGLGPFLWQGLVGDSLLLASGRLLLAALRAGSVDPPVIATRMGRQGRGCRIHRAAVVEGCWVGDGVEIGPGAVVRGSILGDGAIVEEQALVDFSVLSAGARVQRQGLVKLSVLAEGAAVGGLVQLSVIDRRAQVKIGVHLMDMALEQGVQVDRAGRRVPAPLGLAGVCVGARSLVGAGIRVAPGRVLPPDLLLIPPPEGLVRSIPEGLSGLVTVRDGRLVPLEGRGPR